MVGAEVAEGYLIVALSLFGTFALAFGGWIAREMYRTSALLARVTERQDDFDRRINALEGLYLPTHERRNA